MFCLAMDPNTSQLRKIRSKALSLLLSSEQALDFTDRLLSNLLSDQDKYIRLKLLRKLDI
jgi:hypothetical protein